MLNFDLIKTEGHARRGERGSFRLTPQGIELFEIAPGIQLQRDILDQMDFAPLVAEELQVMDSAHFTAA